MNRIRAGVIGTGSIGVNHARVFSELLQRDFTAVYDVRTDAARELASRFGARATTSLEEFMTLVDAATVATPTSTHFTVAKSLLEHGKHILVEKPITENAAEARALSQLAHERGLVLQVGHIERFNPVLAALESRLTRPRFIESHRLSPYPNRSTDIGVVLDLMIHDLEIIPPSRPF
jgi:predicted dehydrogenase